MNIIIFGFVSIIIFFLLLPVMIALTPTLDINKIMDIENKVRQKVNQGGR